MSQPDFSAYVPEDPRALSSRGVSNMAIRNPDDGLLVRFTNEPVESEVKTAAEGRPMFNTVVCITIDVPGDRTMSLHRRANLNLKDPANDIKRFPGQWAAFKGEGVMPEGTPLNQLAFLSVERIAELRASKVHTVEQLANLPDGAAGAVGMGWRELRSQAQAFMEAARGQAPIVKLVSENESLRTELDALKAQFADLAGRLTTQADTPTAGQAKRGPGRPRNDAAAA